MPLDIFNSCKASNGVFVLLVQRVLLIVRGQINALCRAKVMTSKRCSINLLLLSFTTAFNHSGLVFERFRYVATSAAHRFWQYLYPLSSFFSRAEIIDDCHDRRSRCTLFEESDVFFIVVQKFVFMVCGSIYLEKEVRSPFRLSAQFCLYFHVCALYTANLPGVLHEIFSEINTMKNEVKSESTAVHHRFLPSKGNQRKRG